MSSRRRGRGHGSGAAGAGPGASLSDMEQAEVFTGADEPFESPISDEPAEPVYSPAVSDGTRPRRHKNRSRGSGSRLPMTLRTDEADEVAPAGVAAARPVAPEEPSPPVASSRRQTEPAAAETDAAADLDTAAETPRASCTMAQMRRFIKSRPYIPIHELRRRFEIEGYEDDVNPVPTNSGTVYVGLPPQEARYLSDLIKAGEVGCEMLLDPCSPGVVGVYAMRPVARQ